MTTYRRIWSAALTRQDSGYFATTPFFIPFTDDAAEMRKAQFSYLSGLCESYMGNRESAQALLKTSAGMNSELLFAAYYSKALFD